MIHSLVYVGLGGNIGDSVRIVNKAAEILTSSLDFSEFRLSSLYRTSPISTEPQEDYINAVCCFTTRYSSFEVLSELQRIEQELGKAPKPKTAPRIIDLDLLFFGTERREEAQLQLPHPFWKERLFVLIPLSDLADTILVPDSRGNLARLDIHELIEQLQNQQYVEGIRYAAS